MYGFPAMMCHTSGPAPAARTRISTSCSPHLRLLDVPELEHVGLAVPVLHDRLHGHSCLTLVVYGVHLLAYPRVYGVHLSSSGRPKVRKLRPGGERGWRRRSRRPRARASP
jgi:hypothetical protein